MDVNSFFFNVIPGALLIVVTEKYANIRINEILGMNLGSETSYYFIWLIITSIFFGFFFQALTKMIKEKYIYKVIFRIVKDNDKPNFDCAQEFLRNKNLIMSTETPSQELEKTFFVMDNYISIIGEGRHLKHFSSRTAYWSNLFWVSSTVLILCILQIINDRLIGILSLFLLVVTMYETYVHLKNHYDILLKSFVSYIKFEKKGL